MNRTIKSLWVAALRSGDYVQGDGALHIAPSADDNSPDRFCCLGVLCDLALRAGVVEKEIVGNDNVYTYRDPENADSQQAFLPRAVVAWAGLDDDSPIVPYAGDPTGRRTLSSLNDLGKDFTEIADLIEAHL